MTTPQINFIYTFGEQPLFEDLKTIWCNDEESYDKYFDVKFIPLYKKLHLSLLALKEHWVIGSLLFISTISIILSILFSNVGLHPVDVSNPRYMDSLYKNFIGITKISINDFVKKNKSIFMSYDGIHLDYAFVNLYCVPYAFANDGTALIRIDDYGISCLINKKGYVIKFIDN